MGFSRQEYWSGCHLLHKVSIPDSLVSRMYIISAYPLHSQSYTIVKVLPVVMYGSESWTIKKAEHRKIDAFELWCIRRLLSPLDSMEIKPVNPKGNQP